VSVRIAVDARFLTQPLSGVQRYARELCQELDAAIGRGESWARDIDATLLVPRGATTPDLRHLRLRHVGRLTGHAWEQLELPRAARGHDVLFCPGNVAPVASLRGTTPVVTTVHDLAFRYHPETVSPAFRRVYELLVPQVMRHAERVITVSDAERARMLTHFPTAADRLVAVANGSRAPGVDPGAAPSPAPSPAPPPGPFVLYVGALNHRKNVDGVMATVRHLLDTRPDLSAVFVGAGATAYAAVDLGDSAHERVVFAGAVDDASLDAHYRAASLMLFPSFHEASGLPPVEAMARGCPVVVGDIPALRERCGDAAAYCDPHDVGTIVAAAERILDDAALRADLVTRGRERAARFSWERTLRETLEVLRDAAGRPGD
jgi:glycosyltransferase involved in cell wall biosynthesis